MRINICHYCKHINSPSPKPRPTCKAFPDDIPKEISFMKFDHRYPHEGDQGIQFEAADDAPDTVLEWLRTTKRFGETKP